MKPRLILHAGTHKTGTTAFQAFCHENSAALHKLGIWYADYQPVENIRPQMHNRLVAGITGANRGLSDSSIARIVGNWEAQASGATVLVSAEAIYVQKVTDASLDWGQQRLQFLQRLKQVLTDFEVFPILVLRRQDDFVHSSYMESILRGFNDGSIGFKEFRQQARKGRLRYLENLQMLHTVFGRVCVLRYEEIKAHVHTGIFSNVGIDVSNLPPPKRMRESMGVSRAKVRRTLNKGIQWIRPIKLHDLVNRIVNGLLTMSPPGRAGVSGQSSRTDGPALTFWESDQERIAFYQTFTEENRLIDQFVHTCSTAPNLSHSAVVAESP